MSVIGMVRLTAVVAVLISIGSLLLGAFFWDIFSELLDFRLYQLAIFGGLAVVCLGVILGVTVQQQAIAYCAVLVATIVSLGLFSLGVSSVRNLYDLYRLQAIMPAICQVNKKAEMKEILSRIKLDEEFVFDYICRDEEGRSVVMSGYVYGLSYWRYSHDQGRFAISE